MLRENETKVISQTFPGFLPNFQLQSKIMAAFIKRIHVGNEQGKFLPDISNPRTEKAPTNNANVATTVSGLRTRNSRISEVHRKNGSGIKKSSFISGAMLFMKK